MDYLNCIPRVQKYNYHQVKYIYFVSYEVINSIDKLEFNKIYNILKFKISFGIYR